MMTIFNLLHVLKSIDKFPLSTYDVLTIFFSTSIYLENSDWGYDSPLHPHEI